MMAGAPTWVVLASRHPGLTANHDLPALAPNLIRRSTATACWAITSKALSDARKSPGLLITSLAWPFTSRSLRVKGNCCTSRQTRDALGCLTNQLMIYQASR